METAFKVYCKLNNPIMLIFINRLENFKNNSTSHYRQNKLSVEVACIMKVYVTDQMCCFLFFFNWHIPQTTAFRCLHKQTSEKLHPCVHAIMGSAFRAFTVLQSDNKLSADVRHVDCSFNIQYRGVNNSSSAFIYFIYPMS